MYPVKLGFAEAIRRITSLIDNGHSAEALVTSVFTVEKTLRRALKFAIVARGFTSKHADVLLDRVGFHNLKTLWPCFDPKASTLPTLLGNGDWQRLTEAVAMRNKLVHGERAYTLADCSGKAKHVISVLHALRGVLIERLGTDCWRRLPVRRTSALAWMPPAKTA